MTPDLAAIARRVVWFEPPERALANLPRFVAYAMRYGGASDMVMVRAQLGDEKLRGALDAMPPGIIDGRSWSYWNLMLGRYPSPPMPTRRLS